MTVIENALRIIKTDVESKDVLEAACGSADLSVAMSPFARTVKCIDLVDFRLNAALYNCRNVDFSVMDASKISFSDNAFDTVVIYNAVYHLKDEFANVLSECLRVAKSNGAIYVLSSFSIDKSAIDDVVMPALRSLGVKFSVTNSKTLISIRIAA